MLADLISHSKPHLCRPPKTEAVLFCPCYNFVLSNRVKDEAWLATYIHLLLSCVNLDFSCLNAISINVIVASISRCIGLLYIRFFLDQRDMLFLVWFKTKRICKYSQ